MSTEQPQLDACRLDYSPKCIHCKHYCYLRDDCDVQNDDEPNNTYPSCNQFTQNYDDYCSSCGKPYEEGIDQDITEHDGHEEFWGAIVSRPDVLVGFVCDACGTYNEI